jgi:conjugal transfer mating pair stabilization protein TraG
MWDLYVIGDAAYSAAILNGVAAIFGSGNLGTLAGIGFIVGMLITIGQGIITGGRGVSPGGLLMGLVIYLALFAPTTDVRIHSASTGTVRIVANVPFGPAAIGSLMSRIGHSVTDLMEQGFAVPAMNDYGYASPIRTAALMRKATIDGIITEGLQSDNEALYKSFVNYISQCTMVGIQRGELSSKTIYNSGTPLTAIKWDNNLYRSRQFDDSGAYSDISCSDAHTSLSTRVNNDWGGTTYGRFMAPALLQNIEELDSSEGTAEQRAVKKVSEVASILTNSGISNQQLGLNMLIYEMAQQGNIAFFDEHTDASKLAAMMQVRAQRNAAWQLESDNFASVMVPLITFFENFVFAISPLMVFVVFLGAGGIKLLGKYMFLVLWVQMWMPLMAVVNLYLIMSATGSMDTLIQSHAGLGSFAMLSYMGTEVNTWMGVAGKLLASIPAISLMLLYGTSQAATQIARGFEGGGASESAAKAMAPDMASVGASHSVSPYMQGSAVGGSHMTNAQSLDWSTGSTNGWNSQVSSSQKEAVGAKKDYMEQLGTSFGFSMSARKSSSEGASAGTGYQYTDSSADQMAQSVTNDLAKQYGYKQGSSEYSQLSNAVSMQLGGGLSGQQGAAKGGKKGGPGGVKAGFGMAGQDQDGSRYSSERSNDIKEAIAQRYGSTEQATQQLADSASTDLKNGRDNFLTAGLDKQQKEALSKSHSAYRSNAQEYANVQSLGEGGSIGANRSGISISQGMASKGMAGAVDQALQRNGLKGEPYKQALGQSQELGLSGDQAKVHAGLGLLMGHYDNSLSGDRKTAAMEEGAGLINQAFGNGYSTGSDSSRNEDVSGMDHPLASHKELRGPIDSKTRPLESAVNGGLERMGDQLTPLSTTPGQLHNDAVPEIAMHADQQSNPYDGNNRSVERGNAEGRLQSGDQMLSNRFSMGDLGQDGSMYSALKDEAQEFGRGAVNDGFADGASIAGGSAGLSPAASFLAGNIQANGAESTARSFFGDDADKSINAVNRLESSSGAEFSGAQKYAMIVSAMADDGMFHNASHEDQQQIQAAGEYAANEYQNAGGSNSGAYLSMMGEMTKNYDVGAGHIEDRDAPEMLNLMESVKSLSEIDNPGRQQ